MSYVLFYENYRKDTNINDLPRMEHLNSRKKAHEARFRDFRQFSFADVRFNTKNDLGGCK